MRVAVDLDDVLADLISYLMDALEASSGVRLAREQVVDWPVFPPHIHDSARSGGYADLVPLPYAREFLTWLRGTHEVFIVTYREERARQMTLAWLDQHLAGLFDGIRFTGGSKIDACRELAVGLIVDDSARQVPAVTDALGIHGILMDTPMNRHVPDSELIRRATGLREARQIIELLTAHTECPPPRSP